MYESSDASAFLSNGVVSVMCVSLFVAVTAGLTCGFGGIEGRFV